MKISQWIVLVSLSTVFGLFCASPVSSQCGIKEVSVVANRIKGGTESNQNEWPWLCSLVYKSEDKNGEFFCSATLISLKIVITAAHCIQDKGHEKRLSPNDFEVQLGRHNLSDKNELKRNATVLGPIIVIAMHPDWVPTDHENYRYDADIALLISERDTEYSHFIKPICLPDHDIQNVNGTTVGWGFTSDDEEDVEDTPRQAQVERVSQGNCFQEEHELEEIASERTFCVKGVDGEPCIGDSGGGFFVRSGSVWSIHGIVSSSLIVEKCPITKHSLYTKLSAFGDWIKAGIEQFYAVQFSLSIERKASRLTIQGGTLRKGAFLSSVAGSVHYEVEQLVCEDQNLRYFPNNVGYIFPHLRQLFARGLQIILIERAAFKAFKKLEWLSLENNLIEEIPSDCFHELKRVESIWINGNRLKEIHAETFTKNPSLRYIDLGRNRLASIKSKNFNNKNVLYLYLRHNQLTSIPHDAFDGMDNLDRIYLSNNKLTAIHRDIFLNNPKLGWLYIDNNRIQSLPSGLFRNNKDLRHVGFSSNQITNIEATFVVTGDYEFENNTCINKRYDPRDVNELNDMNAELKRLC